MRPSRLRTFISISVTICIVILFHYVGWLGPLEKFLRSIVNPSSHRIYDISVKIGEDTEQFESEEALASAYRDARKRLDDLSVDYAKLSLLESENLELRDSLNFLTGTTTRASLGADVIGKNIEPLGSTLVVNRGERDGVKRGDPVIAGMGLLVGKVMRVEEATSVIQLINDHQSKIIAATLNSDKSIGVVEGGFGISVRMNFIPQNETIHVGDMVVTSGLEEGLPRGLVIGTVEAVEKEAYQPFQRAIITPSARLTKVTAVSIITQR